MSFVNDYAGPNRSDFNKSQVPPPNCKYQVIKSNGWPYVFVMATKNISKGEPLRADYGDAFWETVYDISCYLFISFDFNDLFSTVGGCGKRRALY